MFGASAGHLSPNRCRKEVEKLEPQALQLAWILSAMLLTLFLTLVKISLVQFGALMGSQLSNAL